MMMTRSIRTVQASPPPPELLGAVPRDVRLTGAGTALAVVAIAMAIGALVSAVVMSVAYTRAEGERRLREREGTAVEAELVQVALSRGEHRRRIVTYRFEVNGRTYTGRTALREGDRRDTTQGALIPIEYVSSDPEMSWVIGYEPDGFPLWTIPLVSASLLLAAAIMAGHLRRQLVLLSEGRVAQARITAHKRIHTDKRKAYRVSCEFHDLSGARHTARYEVGKTPPPTGTMVPIVYHRDNPQRNAVYPLQLVRTSRPQPRMR